MKKHTIGTLVTLLALATAGCNDNDINRTIPPIAGIVGGPTAQNGTGEVAVEVRSDPASAVPGQPIVVHNLTVGDVEPVEQPANGLDFQTLIIRADVGHTLLVTLTHPTEGEISRHFEVTSPVIEEIRDPDGTQPVIRAGQVAAVSGHGFCHLAAPMKVFFDGAETTLTLEEPRPGLILFNVPPAATVGAHQVVISVAGAGLASELYASHPFTVSVVTP